MPGGVGAGGEIPRLPDWAINVAVFIVKIYILPLELRKISRRNSLSACNACHQGQPLQPIA